MEKIINWLKASNRWKHLAGGYAIGLLADTGFCAAYTGVGVASALEYKDKAWGGQWNWINWSLTIGGAAAGRVTNLLIRLAL